LGSGEWLNDIIWDATRISPDLFEDEEEQEVTTQKRLTDAPGAKVADIYNVSNDGVYEHSREARFRIRQTFGAIEVFHSQPAKNLQIPFVCPATAREA
jgi:transcription initiation factor TFIID subunit 1